MSHQVQSVVGLLLADDIIIRSTYDLFLNDKQLDRPTNQSTIQPTRPPTNRPAAQPTTPAIVEINQHLW